MTKIKSTKRALLSAVLALLVSVSMLVGTTFAWFTDSVTSGRNTIQSGNLDIELYYSVLDENGNWTQYAKVDKDTKVFNYDLWEPGYTEVAKFKISNEGSLALKYQLTADVYSEIIGKTKAGADIKLSDYIKYGVVAAENIAVLNDRETAAAAATTSFNSFEVKAASLAKETSVEVGMVIAMPTTVGNDANHDGSNKPSIEFGINLIATQEMAESDSFGKDYDENASFPGEAKTAAELIDALKAGQNVKLGANIDLAGVAWTPIATYSGVFDGAGHTISNLKGENGLFDNLSGATVKNLTLENVDIDATSYHTGAVAGYVVKSQGKQTVIDNVTVSGTVNGGGYYVGGIVGADSNYDTVIKNCVNNADVTAPGQQVGGIVGYATRGTLIDNCTNNGDITGGSFVGGIVGMAAGDDEMPELSIIVKNSTNTGAVAETNTAPAVTWQGGVGGIIGNVGRASGDSAVKMLYFYIIDCDVLDGQAVYGQKHNVLGGHENLLTVYVGDTIPAGDAIALQNAVAALGTDEDATFFLTDGNYDGDVNLTVAALGSNKNGNVDFVAVPGTAPVITGTVTIGYREQNIGAATYGGKVAFDGITFDHALVEKHSLNVQDVKSFYMVNCTIIGDGEYGLSSPGSNGTGESKIEKCTFVNAGMQLSGKFAQYLVIDGCTFEESVINVQGGGPLGPTIQNSKFDITLTAAHSGESFYVIRNSNAGANIKVKNCEINVDAEQGFTGVAGSKGWGVFVNRIASYDIYVEDVKITMSDAALAQTALKVGEKLSTGKIYTTNLKVNDVVTQIDPAP